MIKKYNQITTKIVSSFCKRFWKEIYETGIEKTDWMYSIDIMEYQGVVSGPIMISDEYYSLEDIILAEHLQIPCKIVREYNEREAERYLEKKEKDCNLFHFWERYDFYISKID